MNTFLLTNVFHILEEGLLYMFKLHYENAGRSHNLKAATTMLKKNS
jgi:hypothetical protein